MACEPLSYESGFVSGALSFVDCQAQNIGAVGYQALSLPGSTASLVVTGALTLFVALYGYRLLFGQSPGVRDGVLAFARIGIVLTLATSWPAYRVLVYDIALIGPAELAGAVGEPAGLPGSGGGMVDRLQGVDTGLIALARAGTGLASTPAVPPTTALDNSQDPVAAAVPDPSLRQPDGFESWSLGAARIVYLVTVIAGFATVRLVAGILLAIGPFFVAFLLFDGTRGLFEGWIRGLIAAALGAVAVTLLLGVELALLEPWLSELLERRAADLTIAGAPTEVLVATLVFAFVTLGALAVTARLAMGLRMPTALGVLSSRTVSHWTDRQHRAHFTRAEARIPAEQHSRAAAIADAVINTQRREAALGAAGAPTAQHWAQRPTRDTVVQAAPTRLGQSHSRRSQTRVSGSAGKRDST